MRSSSRVPRIKSGFTLLEVLVALVVISLGMLAVIEAVNQTASNSGYLRDKTLAHWVAMNRLTELRLQAQPPALGEADGDVDMADRTWRWRSVVSQTAVATISRIDIAVSPADNRDATLANVTGFYGAAVGPSTAFRISWRQGSLDAAAGDPAAAPPATPGGRPPTAPR